MLNLPNFGDCFETLSTNMPGIGFGMKQALEFGKFIM